MSRQVVTPLMSVVAVLAVAVLLAAGCSGGDGGLAGGGTVGDPEANAPITQIDEGSAGVAAGPITGLLTVQPSFGFGLFDIDPSTGQAAAIPGIAAVETVNRDYDVVVRNGRAFAIGSKVRPGQTFASDESVVRVDYATGEVVQLAALGSTQETDESESRTRYTIEAVTDGSVLVKASEFGAESAVYKVFDAETGEQTSTFLTPRYEFASDASTCSGGIEGLVGLSDGRVAGTALGSPSILDLATGEIEVLINCGEPDPELADYVPLGQGTDFMVFNEGPAPTEETIATLLATDLEPEWGFVEGDGDLWWINSSNRVADDVQALVGGVVRFNLDSGAVEAVYPLGPNLGEFIDCGADSDTCSTSRLGQAELRYIDDRLVMVDIRENGQILILDPATGAITTTPLERGDGVDYTDAEMLYGSPDDIWLQVRRMTITKDDETGRSASGPIFIERLNVESGTVDFSADGEDLFQG